MFLKKRKIKTFKNVFFRLARLVVFDIHRDADTVKGFYPVKDKDPIMGSYQIPLLQAFAEFSYSKIGNFRFPI